MAKHFPERKSKLMGIAGGVIKKQEETILGGNITFLTISDNSGNKHYCGAQEKLPDLSEKDFVRIKVLQDSPLYVEKKVLLEEYEGGIFISTKSITRWGQMIGYKVSRNLNL